MNCVLFFSQERSTIIEAAILELCFLCSFSSNFLYIFISCFIKEFVLVFSKVIVFSVVFFPAIFCVDSFLVLLKRVCCSIQQRNRVFCALFSAIFSISLQVYVKIWYDLSCNIQPMNFVFLFFQPFSAFIYSSLNLSCNIQKKIMFCLVFFCGNFICLIGLLISKSNCFSYMQCYCFLNISFGRVFLRYLD